MEDDKKDDKPVAWRYRHNNKWHYMDYSDPFPPDGWEPLYTRSSVQPKRVLRYRD